MLKINMQIFTVLTTNLLRFPMQTIVILRFYMQATNMQGFSMLTINLQRFFVLTVNMLRLFMKAVNMLRFYMQAINMLSIFMKTVNVLIITTETLVMYRRQRPILRLFIYPLHKQLRNISAGRSLALGLREDCFMTALLELITLTRGSHCTHPHTELQGTRGTTQDQEGSTQAIPKFQLSHDQ